MNASAGRIASPESERRILILYGSETGNGQDIAEDLSRTVERLRFRSWVEEMGDVGLKELLHYRLVIFVMSTTGQGDIPQNATKLWKSLLRRKLPPSCLAQIQFTSFGLGDSSYSKFNWASRKLRKRLGQLGAQEFFPPGEGDERHDDGIDTVYIPWSQELKSYLIKNHPLPPSIHPIPDDSALPPRFSIYAEESSKSSKSGPLPDTNPTDAKSVSQPKSPPQLLLPIPDALLATVQSNTRVTPDDHWQDVRSLAIDIKKPEWSLQPGATVVIYPKNVPEDVDSLIKRMNWEGEADLPLRFSTSSDAGGPGMPLSISSGKSANKILPKGLYLSEDKCTLRDLLTHNLDITAVPKRSFLEKLSFMTPNGDERERLRELVGAGGSQDFYDYTTRPRRTILEILADFPSVKIPLSAVVDVFPVIRGREFSIAGTTTPSGTDSNTLSNSEGHSGGTGQQLRVEILAALVEYRTVIRKPRTGLCSRYLKTLACGSQINITIKPGSALAQKEGDEARPVIAVATGTGIAPIRMLHQTRLRGNPTAAPSPSACSSHPGEMLLFFGCRSRAADYYFADEWRKARNVVTIVPAFSRDLAASDDGNMQEGGNDVNAKPPLASGAVAAPVATATTKGGKTYVQHEIRRHALRVTELVRNGAIICICGSAGDMPRSVRSALQDALVAGGLCGTPGEAGGYLEKEVEIWQEAW